MSCACCLASTDASGRRLLRALPCGHRFCLPCIGTRSRLGLRDRSLLPAHCCRKEFPADYVKEALDSSEFALYERFVNEKHWSTLDLASDREYAQVAKQNGCMQCPGCGVAVLKISGCNHVSCLRGHAFCFTCGKIWKTCYCSVN